MEAKNTLGTPECKLNDITELYTSDLLKFRVINDIYKQEGEDILGITKLIFNYLEITTDQVVGLFAQDRLNSQVLALADPLVKQAILNSKTKYALFVHRGSLSTDGTIAETLLPFVSFVNVFLIRVRQIRQVVTNIAGLLKDFRSLKTQQA